MRIAVYGAGGVGGYFEGRLAQAGTHVHFIDRGAHLQALREHGLRVQSVKVTSGPGRGDRRPGGGRPLRLRAVLRQGVR